MGGTVEGWFDELHFTESFLGEPAWNAGRMVVAVRQLYLCGSHPMADERTPRSGRLTFGGVARSTRTVHEYAGDPHDGIFRPAFMLEESGPGGDGDHLDDYRFGGVREDPPAWLEWMIRAGSFTLEID
jgi:hypothetical protein